MDELYDLFDAISEILSEWDRDDPYVRLTCSAFDVAFAAMNGPSDGLACELPEALDGLRAVLENDFPKED